MLQDYDSIKSDYDIVTVMLKGPLIVNFQIEVLRSREIGSIARYLCEYRGMGHGSFKLMCYNTQTEISNDKKISFYCSSCEFKILVKVIVNLNFYKMDQNPIPEGGDDSNHNSSDIGGGGFVGGVGNVGGGGFDGGEGGEGGSGDGGCDGDNGNKIPRNENKMDHEGGKFNSKYYKLLNNECFKRKWGNSYLFIQTNNTFVNENKNLNSLDFHKNSYSSPGNGFLGSQMDNSYFYSFSKNRKLKNLI